MGRSQDGGRQARPAAKVDRILFGAAYYDEYMPVDRIEADMAMMEAAGINTIRIAESTWSTLEPQPGVFDYSHVDRALAAAHKHGISVIVGTPTYAVPAWLAAMHPEVLARTPEGQRAYGPRQIMDIVNPAYRWYGERVIRRLVTHVADRPGVIGYQVDNETKYYDCVSTDMQSLFVKHLRKVFRDDLDALNREFGLDYWSNRIDSWQDFPDVSASINGSLSAEFDKFRRMKVSEYLEWQADIVRECARPGQFVTHNLDFEWRGYSYGVQPAVDHFEAAKSLDIAGVDIYHPTEDDLTGKEIAFGGDMARSLKGGANYLVLETEAQGQNGWLPYPGQLRLQAYSHLASGADGVMYWHWHSIHNSFETYWKGLLSHDFEPNPTYEEAGVFGREIADHGLGGRLRHLRKRNRVAIMVSNESLTGLEWFSLDTGFPGSDGPKYNDVVRRVYDALFDLNVECDFVPTSAAPEELSRYAMLLTPSLYSAPESTLEVLRGFVHQGGYLLSTVRSFVADEYLKVWHDRAPHQLTEVFGMTYNQFTRPKCVGLSLAEGKGGPSGAPAFAQGCSQALMELLKPAEGTEVLATYDHPVWSAYAAVTRNRFGRGEAEWIGTLPDPEGMRLLLAEAVKHAGLWGPAQELAGRVVIRRGINGSGEQVTYMLNYSSDTVTVPSPCAGRLLVGKAKGVEVGKGEDLDIGPWDLAVLAGPRSEQRSAL
ncbi:beta-galactosidase [Bifidobacterium xylocopae]|uniref:beta-galactosidase n=1 Tax=Bifidobacterium xylocopae TaxID=2493119 RepID=A0A366KEF1_9BIFI|nr:beta-galactosidase [Bifidobacterium xylocopae]RBP99051.1 beta-galactosidase [Bifidobacterium xylocopae]